MVQVGNEINHGMIWPEGSMRHPDSLAALIYAGIRGVKTVDPTCPIMLHIALGGQNDESHFWLDNMLSRKVPFDVIGLSYYPPLAPDVWPICDIMSTISRGNMERM